MTILLPFVTLFVIFLAKGAESTTFTFNSNCPFTVWPATLAGSTSAQLPQTGFQLNQGASVSLHAPAGWSGRMWARRMCSTDSSGRFSCEGADCGSGQVACNGAGGATPATLVEFTLNGAGGQDFYDISLVDGYNLPVRVASQGGSGGCVHASCPVDIDARCPGELQFNIGGSLLGCKSACDAFNTDQYCCRGAYGTSATCPPTAYSQDFKSACPQAYSYAYDDSSSTFTCTGANYLITFCP